MLFGLPKFFYKKRVYLNMNRKINIRKMVCKEIAVYRNFDAEDIFVVNLSTACSVKQFSW